MDSKSREGGFKTRRKSISTKEVTFLNKLNTNGVIVSCLLVYFPIRDSRVKAIRANHAANGVNSKLFIAETPSAKAVGIGALL
jgi:hypothetical protein